MEFVTVVVTNLDGTTVSSAYEPEIAQGKVRELFQQLVDGEINSLMVF